MSTAWAEYPRFGILRSTLGMAGARMQCLMKWRWLAFVRGCLFPATRTIPRIDDCIWVVSRAKLGEAGLVILGHLGTLELLGRPIPSQDLGTSFEILDHHSNSIARNCPVGCCCKRWVGRLVNFRQYFTNTLTVLRHWSAAVEFPPTTQLATKSGLVSPVR